MQNGEWWRVFMPVGLHFTILHILFNGYSFFSLGRVLEHISGRAGVIVVFFLTGLVGNLTAAATQIWFNGGGITAGASGGVCGLLGFLLFYFRRRQDEMSRMISRQLLFWSFFILVMSFGQSISLPAHAGGFVSGALLSFLMPTAHIVQVGRRSRLAGLAAVLWLAFMISALGAGIGTKGRFDTIKSAFDLRDSLATLESAADRGQLPPPQLRQGVLSNDVDAGLAPVRKRTLEILGRGEVPTQAELNGLNDRLLMWFDDYAPDFLTRRK